MFEHAARAAGNEIGAAGILKGLYTVKGNRFGGVTSSMTYLPGKPAPDSGRWFIMQAVNGKWTAPQGDRLDCR